MPFGTSTLPFCSKVNLHKAKELAFLAEAPIHPTMMVDDMADLAALSPSIDPQPSHTPLGVNPLL